MKKSIPGYEGLYSITDDGQVINDKTYRILKCSNNNGYRKITLIKNSKTTTFRIHRLVATAFVWNPDELPYVDHIDENKINNCSTNLRWCTNQQNLDWHYENNPERRQKIFHGPKKPKIGKPVMVDKILYPSAGAAAKYIANKEGKNQETISKEIRRRHLRDGHKWLMYNKYQIGY